MLTGANSPALKELPLLRDSPPGPKREALFRAKLALCSVEFNWIEGGESDAAAGGGGEGGDKPPGGPAALTTEQLMLLKQYNGVTGVSAASNAAALAEAAAKERRGKEMKVRAGVYRLIDARVCAGNCCLLDGSAAHVRGTRTCRSCRGWMAHTSQQYGGAPVLLSARTRWPSMRLSAALCLLLLCHTATAALSHGFGAPYRSFCGCLVTYAKRGNARWGVVCTCSVYSLPLR